MALRSALRQVPNFLTLCNLFCGCIGISSGLLEVQVAMILLGMCFDFADGVAARLLKAQSEMGKQLDSLADMVTFGVLPSVVLFDMSKGILLPTFPHYLVFVYALGVAWRLARFNSFESNKSYFIGLPSPAAAFVVASIAYADFAVVSFLNITSSEIALFFAITLAVLMVVNIPLLSLKFKNIAWHDNLPRYIFIFISLVLGLIIKLNAVPLIILTYFTLSILFRDKIINP